MERWKVNLIILWIGQFLVMAGMTMIVPFLPYYIQELGVTDPDQVALWAGFIFAGNFVTSFIFQPLWGKLADRYGRKIMLLRSGFGMSIVIILMGFSTSVWQLLLLRMLNGTISGFTPAAVSLLSSSVPKEKAGFAMGTLQSGSVAGSIFGPLIGGLMAAWYGYRPIFYITGTLLAIASLLVLLMVKENFDKASAARQPNFSVIKGFHELRKVRQLPALFTVTALIQFSLLSSMPMIPLFIQSMDVPAESLAFYAGLVTSVMGFSNMMASPVLGRLSDRIGAEKVLLFSLVFAAISFIPQALVHSVWQLLAARFFLGLCMGGMLPTVNSLILKYTPNGMEGRAYSFNTSALGLGNLMGPIIGGLLFGWISIRGIFIVASCLLFLNAFWARQSLAGRRSSPEQQE